MSRKPFFYDITLRDGNQALKKPWNLKEKEKIFNTLIELNVDGIEIGFPHASNMDFESTRHLAIIAPKNVVVSGLARTKKEDIDDLKIALLLYDIGNIMVPEEIFNKPQLLTYEEKLKIDSLEISVNTKQQKIEKQKEDIIKLKQDKKDLNDLIDYWKNKFLEIIKLIKDKLFGKKEEREQYMDIANELYNKDIIDTKLFDEMYNIYEKIEKYDNNRGKFDDFEL